MTSITVGDKVEFAFKTATATDDGRRVGVALRITRNPGSAIHYVVIGYRNGQYSRKAADVTAAAGR